MYLAKYPICMRTAKKYPSKTPRIKKIDIQNVVTKHNSQNLSHIILATKFALSKKRHSARSTGKRYDICTPNAQNESHVNDDPVVS